MHYRYPPPLPPPTLPVGGERAYYPDTCGEHRGEAEARGGGDAAAAAPDPSAARGSRSDSGDRSGRVRPAARFTTPPPASSRTRPARAAAPVAAAGPAA